MIDDINIESTELPLPDGALRLPSGGWALLKPSSLATGRDVRVIRRALNEEGTGDIMSGAMAATLGALVVDWQIPGRPQLPLPMAGRASLDMLPADDLLTLEEAVRPFMLRILGQEPKRKAGESDPS